MELAIYNRLCKGFIDLIMNRRSLYVNFIIDNLRLLFKNIDSFIINRTIELKYPPIFIIGPPRTGSTLLTQIITHCFKVCYFSNLMMKFPESPVLIAAMLGYINHCNPGYSFKSNYGEIDGWKSHSHGLKIFNRWLNSSGRNANKNTEYLSNKNFKEMRNTVSMLEIIFNAPFVNKSQSNSLRIKAISTIFPEALFIRVKRDPVLSAQSVLLYKRTLNRWTFIKPKNFSEIRFKSDIEKACEIILGIENEIDHQINKIEKDKVLLVRYEELCKSPVLVMDKIKKFYITNQNKYALMERNDIPCSFPCSNNIKIKLEEFKAIQEFFK